MTTALFLLRCYELGIGLADLEELTIGEIFDMMTEKANDRAEYDYVATQADFDRF